MVERETLFPDICEPYLKTKTKQNNNKKKQTKKTTTKTTTTKKKQKQNKKEANTQNLMINTPDTYRTLYSHPLLTISHHGHLSGFRQFYNTMTTQIVAVP